MLSDTGTNTLIKPDTALYKALLTMKLGSTVRIHGRLFASGPDCYREKSVTLAGSLEDPDFLVRFSRIEPIELP
jgi:hypothetical protein